jgi:hypothetical protein
MHLRERRERIATAALQGFLAAGNSYTIANFAVKAADALIAALDTPPAAK